MTRAGFRQSDLTRAIRAAKLAGMAVTRCEILPDGRIVLSEAAAESTDNPFDTWKSQRENRPARNP